MNKDYYVILGLGKDATEEQIKKAYKRKALQFHPDKNKEPDSEEKFKEIAEAYEVLSDGDKKSTFDEYGVEGLNRKGGKSGSYFRSKSAFDPSDPMDLFKTFFGEHDPFAGILTSIFNQHAHHANFNFGSNQFCKVKNASSSKDHVKDDPAATTSYEEQIGDGGTVQMTKTIIGGDGRVRREMRFRTQSAGTEEDGGRKDDGSLSLGRQHSAPTGHVSTSTPVRLHRPNIRQGNNSSGKEKETSTAEITLKTTKPLKSSNKIKIIQIKTAEPQTAETCKHGDKIVTIPETKITITLNT